MQQLGIWMIILGAGSFLLNMAGREFILLSWVDAWGPAAGTGIRIGIIALGAVITAAASASDGGE